MTCIRCGHKGVAKEDFYSYTTQCYSKAVGKYYPLYAYQSWCKRCSNTISRRRSKEKPDEHRLNAKRSYARLHAKKDRTRAFLYPEVYAAPLTSE